MSLESLYIRDAEDWTLAHYQKWSKETKPVNPKGNHPWIFIGRTGAEAEAPIVWPLDVKSWHTGKDPDAGKDWKAGEGDDRECDGSMASPTQWTWVWVKTPGVGDGQQGLACCSPWGCKESDTTEPLNWTELPVTPLRAGVCVWEASGV